MKKIGILLPKSTYYATIGFDIFEGIKTKLQQIHGSEIKIITENIGFGADKQQCYRSAERLLLDENVDIIVAYIGHRTAQLLRPLFLAANKILVVLDSGANLPQEWSVCPNIVYLSLHNALGASLTAQLAVDKGHTVGGLVTGYYDGGYLHTYSISKSFEIAGGSIGFNHATGYKEEDFTMQPLMEHLENYPNAALLTLFSGDFIQWYFAKIKNSMLEKKASIFLSPFGLEESMLEDADFPGGNVQGIAAWSKKIENVENATFIKSLESVGKTPNLFSLLGWEAATFVSKILSLLEHNNNNIGNTISDLDSYSFESPRGNITFLAKYNYTVAPLYEVNMVANDTGNCAIEIVNTIENTSDAFEKLFGLDIGETNSAWYNSYVCI